MLAMHLPPGCATFRQMGGPLAWTPEMFVQAAAVHALRVANWQRTEDAKNQRNYPAPVEPPGYEEEHRHKEARIAQQAERFLQRQRLRAELQRNPEGVGDGGHD